jgi:hypothetical protein
MAAGPAGADNDVGAGIRHPAVGRDNAAAFATKRSK